MSEYKRFISYVYDYINGTKGSNRGFIKTECRQGICQFSITLKGLCRDSGGSCRIYGFRRAGSSPEGTYLITAPVQSGILHMDIRFPDGEIGNEKYSINSMAGIILVDDDGTYYATQWDDEPQNLEGFSNIRQSSDNTPVPGTAQTSETEPAGEPETSRTFESAPTPKESSSPNILSEIENSAAPGVIPVPEEQTAPQDDLHATSMESTAADHLCFRDGCITDCVKITPKDIQKFHRNDWHLANNRFVHYGYQMFGHLLVGQLVDTGETVLCVPGSYHQQECLMANMFGFNHFKKCPGQCPAPRCFGYWYRSIHPTDPGSGDCPA